MDTIDVSNLNRQFLFQKQHVGQSKAKVARESALRFNPDAKIVAHHADVRVRPSISHLYSAAITNMLALSATHLQ